MTASAALQALQARAPFVPELAIVLGSGLGALAESAEAMAGSAIPFTDLPGFPAPTVAGHGGKLVFCEFEGRKTVLQAGRFHFYEGHPMPLVVTPMRLYGRLGVKAVLLTNAAGALNPAFGVGELMALTDHINLFGTNPLIGLNVEPGPRFPDMTAVYDPAFRTHLAACAAGLGQTLRQGVYLGLTGPSYETPAEIRAFRLLGADAVGMSTVPEAIVARHEGMRVAGISCLCNMAAGILPQALTHQEVLEAGAAAAGRFEALVRAFVRDLPL
ncbi:purine-nucleoside phosphorylase [Geothrix fuzhouensis]|uniref:purine-nucleoside phosphorylase n=1 Tax=Geothrix fuzhouensis TaxID=2966451 RepID=UPI0021485DDE|nr:purine-nucleoside phosphorylase [Geothrix fuzhouensis]